MKKEYFPRLYVSPCRMADVWNKCPIVGVATTYLEGDISYISEMEVKDKIEKIKLAAKEWERLANEWMKDYDKLKAKYEPMVAAIDD